MTDPTAAMGDLSDIEDDVEEVGEIKSRSVPDRHADSSGRGHTAPFWLEGHEEPQCVQGAFVASRRPEDQEKDPDSYLASPAELEDIAEMRRRLAGLLKEPGISTTDDVVGNLPMLRFLRAHSEAGGMDLVCEKYSEMLRWRRDEKVDELRSRVINKRFAEMLWDGNHDVLQFMPTGLWTGVNRNGDVILIDRTGLFDMSGVDAKHGIQKVAAVRSPTASPIPTPTPKPGSREVVTWNIHHLEWMQRQLYLLSRKHNRVARFVKIIDLSGHGPNLPYSVPPYE